MKKQKGFTLIELLIVVAIIGIIAAIAIPSLLRARIAANEADAIGDSRTVVSASVTYQSGNGSYEAHLGCMSVPSSCSWPTSTTQFLDPAVGKSGTPNKQGYNRIYTSGTTTTGLYNNGPATYTFAANPVTPGGTGTRYFGTDHSGLICQDGNAAIAFSSGAVPTNCTPI